MKRISSKGTAFYKRGFPLLWFGFLGVFFVFFAPQVLSGGPLFLPVLLAPVVLAAFGYLLFRRFAFDLLDEVWDDGDHLLLKKGGLEDRIALANIINIGFTVAINPPRVTLTLRQPCRFGREVTFSPPSTGLSMRRSPLVDELIERVDRARSS